MRHVGTVADQITNPLRLWMQQKEVRQTDVAKSLGVASQLVARWMREGYLPSLKTAATIERLTAGAVKLDSFLNLPPIKETPEYEAGRKMVAERRAATRAKKREGASGEETSSGERRSKEGRKRRRA